MSTQKSEHTSWQNNEVSEVDRLKLLGHRPMTIWLTGLSASGKSTLAFELERVLIDREKLCCVLDGDNLRHGLNNNLGFSPEDRTENIRRIAEVAKLMNEAGMIVIAATISPYEKDRNMAKTIISSNRFLEVYISTPLEVCEARDPKQLYKNARSGKISNFTGITSEYEPPKAPTLNIDTHKTTKHKAINLIINELISKDIL